MHQPGIFVCCFCTEFLHSFKKKILMFLLFLREIQSASGGGSEREGDTGSQAGSRFQAVSTEPDVGLKPTNREIVT